LAPDLGLGFKSRSVKLSSNRQKFCNFIEVNFINFRPSVFVSKVHYSDYQSIKKSEKIHKYLKLLIKHPFESFPGYLKLVTILS